MRKNTMRNISTLLSIVLMIVFLFPVFWVVLTSIKNRNDIFTWPPVFIFEPTFESYIKFLSKGSYSILNQLSNSLVISLGSVCSTLICSGLAAYSFSRFRFRFRFPLLMGVLGTRLLPPVTALVPVFLSFNKLGLIDTRIGLILIYTALNIPFSIWMMKSYIDSVPAELEESAQIDGCTRLQSLRYVLLPLAMPGIVAVAIFVFRVSWNEFMFAFIFTSTQARTLPIRIAETVGELQIFWTDMAALTVILMVPALIFSFFMQKNLVKGLTAGALK